MKHPNENIMRKCIGRSLKNKTLWVAIVKRDKIVAEAGGAIFSKSHDVTGHSEINAIRKACKKLGNHELRDCWIYTPYEPCTMCISAICWAKMNGIVYGASHRDRNKVWPWGILIPSEKMVKKSSHRPKIIGEFMRKEAKRVLGMK